MRPYLYRKYIVDSLKMKIMKPPFSIVCYLLLSVASVAQQAPSTTLAQEIEREARALQKAYNVPGLGVAVVIGDQVIVCKGFGWGDIDQHVPCTEKTIFRLASATKFLTGLAVLSEVQQGALHLEDSLSQYVTDIPASWQGLPLWRLLNHTSGIPSTDETPFDKMTEDEQRKVTERGLFQLIHTMPLDFAPGSKWRYQQTGFALVAMILTDKLHEPWTEIIKKTITDPAGMENTFLNDETVYPAGQDPKNYNYADGKLTSTPFFFPLVLGTGAGFNMNATDAARLFQALNEGKIVSAETIKKEVFDTSRMYALGPHAWYSVSSEVKPFGPYLTAGHSGGPDLANFRYSPDKKVGVAVFSDRNNTGVSEELTNRILNRILLDSAFSVQHIPVTEAIRDQAATKTLAELSVWYEHARANPGRYRFDDAEDGLNSFGYDLLGGHRFPEALKVFQLLVKEFPTSANGWDSLGEAYATSGDRQHAIASYQKCLQLNPGSESAKKWLEKLQHGY
jgi:CubicO group peptidase (beta-lactamase class C family)